MSNLKFVGLHAHSVMSIGDGFGYPKDHFDFVIKNGQESSMALAMTDHGNANSFGYVLQALKEYKKKGVPFKPIFGIEAYYHPSLSDWQKTKDEQKELKLQIETSELVVENESESKSKWYDPIKRRHHLVVLAKNEIGLKNLFRLVTWSYRHGFYRFPRIDYQMLEKCREGLIISSACLGGPANYIIMRDQDLGSDLIQKSLDLEFKPLYDLFGKENAYCEIQFNKIPEQRLCNDELIKFSQRTGYKLIATADSHYNDPSLWRDRELYKLLGKQSKGYGVTKEDLPKTIEELQCELYPKNGDQMLEEYKKMYSDNLEHLNLVQQAIERTHAIAHEQIESIQPDGSMKLPVSFLEGKDPFQELKKLCVVKLKEKNLENNREYTERLVKELKVIKDKDFSLYFLNLHRAINKVREKILVAPGRGSGASSLVNYLLNITQIDPIKYGLIFERFLSASRPKNEPPDIDTDVEDRDVCIESLKEEFGENDVIAISNYNTLQLKSLVKDISKLYDIPYQEVNEVTSVMEKEAKPAIMEQAGGDQKFYVFDYDNAMAHSPTFASFIEKYPQVGEQIVSLFRQVRSIGVHAGGVILAEHTEEIMPVQRVRGTDQTPWSEGLTVKHLEDWGLIKYDFLGLATLAIIRKCIESVLKNQGNSNPSMDDIYDFYNQNLHPDVIDTKDQKIFSNVYWQGRFPGVFQFAEGGVRSFAQRARPESVEDISAITATWRPGPLKGHADKKYVANKSERVKEHPILEEVLGYTRGLILYQEQFMFLANKLAGFSLEESDKLRKLLVKPVTSMAEEMKRERLDYGIKFVNGCIERGLDPDRATTLWEDEILGFISYGFVKAHAQSYAFISYMCAYLFTYHEKEWLCAYLDKDPDKETAINEVKALGYEVSKIDINSSKNEWSIDGKKIIPPFTSIKGIGNAAVEEITSLRPFTDIYDMIYEKQTKQMKSGPKEKWVCRLSKFNKKSLDAMIKLNALDSLGCVGYSKLFENYAHMHRTVIENWDKIKTKPELLSEIAQTVDKTDWTQKEKAAHQQELLGTYDKSLILGQDVLDFFKQQKIQSVGEISKFERRTWFAVDEVKTAKTKTDNVYYKLSISDLDSAKKMLNYFGEAPEGGLESGCIYMAPLHINENGFVNVKRFAQIEKIS